MHGDTNFKSFGVAPEFLGAYHMFFILLLFSLSGLFYFFV